MSVFSNRRVSWTSIAIIVGLPVLLAVLTWLIWILSDPVKWCSVRVADTRLATSSINDCTSIEMELIKWLGWIGVGLLAVVAIAFLVIVTRDLKAGIDAQGWGFKIRTGDDAAQAADEVAGAAADAAADIKGGVA
jgi:hypothetical protein